MLPCQRTIFHCSVVFQLHTMVCLASHLWISGCCAVAGRAGGGVMRLPLLMNRHASYSLGNPGITASGLYGTCGFQLCKNLLACFSVVSFLGSLPVEEGWRARRSMSSPALGVVRKVQCCGFRGVSVAVSAADGPLYVLSSLVKCT